MPRILESRELSIIQGQLEFKFEYKILEHEEMREQMFGGRVATGKTYTVEYGTMAISYDGIEIMNPPLYGGDIQRIKAVILKEEAKKIATGLIEGTRGQDGGENE